MQSLLLDEGAFSSLAAPMRSLGLDVWTPGDRDAPPRQSSDDTNCEWCARRGAVLVTTDRGRKDPTIHTAIARHGVGTIFMHRDLRVAPPHRVLFALLRAEEAMDDLASRRKRMSHRLTPAGRLGPRAK